MGLVPDASTDQTATRDPVGSTSNRAGDPSITATTSDSAIA